MLLIAINRMMRLAYFRKNPVLSEDAAAATYIDT